MIKLLKVIVLLGVLSIKAFGQQAPIKVHSPEILTSAGFRSMAYLSHQTSNVVELPEGVGDYCSNWIKMNNTTPRNQLPTKFFPKMYRAVICRPVEGKCSDAKNCAMAARGPGRPFAEYVQLPENDLKFEKDGTTIEFESDVELDSKTERGKYLEGKYAALFNLPTSKKDSPLWFCSIPIRVRSEGAEPKKPDDTIACLATETKDGSHGCPGVKACYDKKIESHPATMAFNDSTSSDSALVTTDSNLRPHAPSLPRAEYTHGATTH
jgi:hypothetical protein